MLADTGHLDVAYELLLQDTEPSWLVMIDRGATTVWERWNGVDADGVPHESLNHYSKGAVVSFLHRYAAGHRAARRRPAYRRFRVRPRPGGGLTSAEAAHESPYGRIEVGLAAGRRPARPAVVVPARHRGRGRPARRDHVRRRPAAPTPSTVHSDRSGWTMSDRPELGPMAIAWQSEEVRWT